MNSKFISLLISTALLLNLTVPVVYSASINTGQNIMSGNKYAKAGHDYYSLGDYLKAAHSYEKAYQLTKLKLYLDNAVVAYTSYAYNLTNNKKYDEALKYTNQILSLKPGDKNAGELLSDIYFSRGTDYFYTGEVEKAKADFTTSLKYSSEKEQIDRAKEGLSRIQTAVKENKTPVPKYQETSDSSIPETVSVMESKIYGNSNKTDILLDRITKLEKDTLGKTYESDSLIVRTDRLKRIILPENIVYEQGKISQGQNYNNTYVSDIIQQSMGRITIFGKMPIAVYIDENNVKSYRKFYKDAAIDGFKEWEKASEGRIKFQFIDEPAKADIKVVWAEDFYDFPWEPDLKKEDLSAEKERMKYQKASALTQAGSVVAMIIGSLVGVPFVGGLGALGTSVASPLLQYKGTKIEKLSPDLEIGVKPAEGLSDDAARTRIKQIAIHQMGHALGIFGHSKDPKDIMFDNFTAIQLSERDINTIREIYKSKDPTKK